MTWKEQLLTREWNNKRTEILLRDNFKCQHPGCGKQFEGIEVHHIEYCGDWKAWEYPNDWLTSLCGQHHNAHHKNLELAERLLLRTLKTRGFLMSDLLALSAYFETEDQFTQSLLKTIREYQNG